MAAAIFGPLVSRQDPYGMEVLARLSPPSPEHFLGTDEYGRDILIRLLYGARLSLGLAFLVTFCSTLLGLIIGLYSASSKWLDEVIMRLCDGLAAIPGILLAIALMAALGSSLANVTAALILVYTPSMARIARSSALSVYASPFVEALTLQGAGSFRLLWLHVAPNALAPVLVQAAFVFSESILAEAALSFLGLGVTPPAASWGNMLQAGKAVIGKAWWLTAFPGLSLAISVLGLQLIGDGLRDYWEPTREGGG
jgi:peptide/nickel transport system permease protein